MVLGLTQEQWGSLAPVEGDEAPGSHGEVSGSSSPHFPGPVLLSLKPAALASAHPDPSQFPCFTPALGPSSPPFSETGVKEGREGSDLDQGPDLGI